MVNMRRTLLGVVLAATVAVFGLSACGRTAGGGAGDVADQEMTNLSWDGQALEAIGFAEPDLLAAETINAPAPAAATPSPKADGRRHPRLHRLRNAFGRNVQHGEAVVTTEEGTKTVVVQRGTVTAINDTSVTVKSADGFTLTWKFGDPFHVVEHRTKIQASAIAVGTQVGVAGAKEGDATVARLLVVPGPKPAK